MKLALAIALMLGSRAAWAQEAAPAPEPVSFSGQVRTRGEVWHERDLDASVDAPLSDGEFVLLRTRFGVEARPTDGVKVVIQAQDARLFGSEPTTSAHTPNLDLHQGYLEVNRLFGQDALLRVGRMELAYGDQRLVGAFAWDNAGRAFDGVHLRTRPGRDWTLDAFAARLHFDRSGDRALGDDFAGIYGSRSTEGLVVDLYALYLYDAGGFIDTDGDGILDMERFPGGGAMHLFTPGVRVDAQLGGLSVNAEVALQLGARGDLSVFALAAHARLAYAQALPLAPAFFGGAAFSPGDSDAGDDRWQTFENLFPTNHLHYGYMDMASWKNILAPYLGLSGKLNEKLTIEATAHVLMRAGTHDTFYRASGAPLRDRATAAASDAALVGVEPDLYVVWKPLPKLSVLGGVSFLLAGAFLDDTSGGGFAPSAAFGYLQAAAAF